MCADKLKECLNLRFGLQDFRHSQRAIIESVLSGKDTLAVMPTGGGKSLCYQLPALMFDGVTFIVSPLIALMKDQVDALNAKGIAAACINSAQSLSEQKESLLALKSGKIKLLYIAPERFKAQSFLSAIRGVNVSLFAVDEAHCISQWGHDFRPDYMRLGKAAKLLGNPVVAAFTATATEDVRRDIVQQLSMQNPSIFVSGFERPNLSFNVRSVSKKAEKLDRIIELYDKYKTGIVYCATVKSAESLSEDLVAEKVPHILYHGKMSPQQRDEAQDLFMSKKVGLAVATNAFGMGIDRPDIRFVCHYELCGSIESYYQEAGRAGRDGKDAYCEMLFMYADKRVQEFFIEGANPDLDFIKKCYRLLRDLSDKEGFCQLSIEEMTNLLSERGKKKANQMAVSSALSILRRYSLIERFDGETGRVKCTRICDLSLSERDLPIDAQALLLKKQRDLGKLKSVLAYAYSSGCRQRWILDYFGETCTVDCGKCDKCRSGVSYNAQTVEGEKLEIVRKALSCVARMSYKRGKNMWEPRFGKDRLIKCLVGSKDEKIISARLNELSTYAILKEYGKNFVSRLVDCMIDASLIELSCGDYPLVGLSSKGIEVMLNAKSPYMEFPEIPEKGEKRKAKIAEKAYASDEMPDDTELYKKLISKRNQLCHLRGNVPAYMVFPNTVLKKLADLKPKNAEEAMSIKGIGEKKAATLLPTFLKIIAEHNQ